MKCKELRNKALKQSILQEIGGTLKASSEEINRKHHNLQNQYNGELKKLKKSGGRYQ